MEFLRKTPFVLDFGNLLLPNPETEMETELSLIVNSMVFENPDVKFPSVRISLRQDWFRPRF